LPFVLVPKNFYSNCMLPAPASDACSGKQLSATIGEVMRVIAGKFRSRTLIAPRGLDTRPTSDRLRETLFNVLAPRIEGSAFLDLYAGSGANGIEALSRGAKQAVFVEKAAPAIAAIRANLQTLKIETGYQLEARSVAASLKRLMEQGQIFDIVFLDPPYKASDEYAQVLGSLGGDAGTVLAHDAIVIAEHYRKQLLEDAYGNLRRYRLLEQGDAVLSFYAFQG
jgi:16S rRNA (guanine966-N2)-methyltransferase